MRCPLLPLSIFLLLSHSIFASDAHDDALSPRSMLIEDIINKVAEASERQTIISAEEKTAWLFTMTSMMSVARSALRRAIWSATDRPLHETDESRSWAKVYRALKRSSMATDSHAIFLKAKERNENLWWREMFKAAQASIDLLEASNLSQTEIIERAFSVAETAILNLFLSVADDEIMEIYKATLVDVVDNKKL